MFNEKIADIYLIRKENSHTEIKYNCTKKG